ncbi:MAG: hypothetical protein QOC65_906 [Sphingomonadales bacterium]|nr:hypothetical protein [Sphingomonadales bacterium]
MKVKLLLLFNLLATTACTAANLEKSAGDNHASEAASRAACAPGQDDRVSEICAAWASADAAREAARWSFWQLLISIGGLAGLFYSLQLTRRATSAAVAATADTERSVSTAERNANSTAELVRISQTAAEAELRCYLDFTTVEFTTDDLRNTKDEMCLGVRITTSNFGRTPAIDVSLHYSFFFVAGPAAPREEIYRDTLVIGPISPSDKCNANLWAMVSAVDLEELRTGARLLHIAARAVYKDVFGHSHELASEFENVRLDGFHTLEGTRAT